MTSMLAVLALSPDDRHFTSDMVVARRIEQALLLLDDDLL
jgi:hypothetical protein